MSQSTSRFVFTSTPLDGLRIVTRQQLADARGFLARLWCAEEFSRHGWSNPVLQINHSLTRRHGTIRGMHFQHPPHAEDKLVSCLHGEIFDVAVDLRRGSPTFLNWHGLVLSAKNARSLLIPRGFAHGFQTLADDCELVYLHTTAYRSDAEGGIDALDPRLAIAWPLPPGDRSPRDEAHPPLAAEFDGVSL
jgi:dTDP-4-dehydrorhamnose 3,5-epimerase